MDVECGAVGSVALAQADRDRTSERHHQGFAPGTLSPCEKGVTLKALAQDINTSTAAGRLIFHILVTVAQFEREWSNERSLHGLMKARERGNTGGRRPTYTDDEITSAMIRAKGNYERAGKLCGGAKKITMIRRWKVLIAKKPSLVKAIKPKQKEGARV